MPPNTAPRHQGGSAVSGRRQEAPRIGRKNLCHPAGEQTSGGEEPWWDWRSDRGIFGGTTVVLVAYRGHAFHRGSPNIKNPLL